MIPNYEFHELANLFPAFTPEDYQELKTAIAAKGVLVPIVLYENKILDGRTRYQISRELNLDPPFEPFTGEDPLSYVLNVNLGRRTLSAEQKACIGLEYLQIEQERAKQRQIEAGRATGKKNAKVVMGISQASEEEEKPVKRISQASTRAPTSREIVAEKVGTNGAYIQTAKRIHEKAPELFAQMKSGSLNFLTAKLLTDFKIKNETLAPELYPKVIERMKTHPKEKAKDIIKNAQGVFYESVNQTLTIPMGKKWRVLYADPPWDYGEKRPGVTSPSEIYQTSVTDVICNTLLKDGAGNERPVKDIMAKDAVLFMWTSSPHLEQSFDVIKAWGFEYKTTFIWHKIKHNMGFYGSVRHEILLVATRGACTPDKVHFTEEDELEKLKLYPSVYPSTHIPAEKYGMEPEQYGLDSVYEEERTEHSKKPQYYYDLIERMYKFGPYLEMYCRSPHPGWDFWGNQADQGIQSTGNVKN